MRRQYPFHVLDIRLYVTIICRIGTTFGPLPEGAVDDGVFHTYQRIDQHTWALRN